jgi:hypothetical protein
MRAFIAAITLLLGLGMGLGSAVPDPEYASLFDPYFSPSASEVAATPIEAVVVSHRGDRLALASADAETVLQVMPDLYEAQPILAPVNLDSGQGQVPQASLDDLCNALFTSAEDNGLPVQFFANLIWQESRLRDDAVSPVGALGIAQFMPEVALEAGLQNPFDPLQAIPASARLLRELRAQFGNLGFVAAAYNAGAHRVSEWLARGRALPRETVNYVMRVTGRTADQWRVKPADPAALKFTDQLPCRRMPAFADLEQVQNQTAEASTAQLAQDRPAESLNSKVTPKAEAAIQQSAADRRRTLARAWAKALNIAAADRSHDARHSQKQRQAYRARPRSEPKSEHRPKIAELKSGRTRYASHRA